MLGTSYHAINQYQVAALHPGGLAAILPWEGAFDLYREVAYYGGILNVSWKFWWDHKVVPSQNGNAETPLIDFVGGGKDTGAPLPPEVLKQNRLEPVVSFAKHPFDDEYWHGRSADGGRITVPLLLRRGARAAEALLRALLKGVDNGWEKEPRVEIEVRRPDGAAWRAASAWPLPATRWQRWYLDDANGTMSPALHAATPAEKSYSGLGEGLTFTSTPFAEETEFTGPIGVRLWVGSSTADMDVCAAVRLIDPVTFMGNSDPNVPLAQGYLRVSHRAVDPARSTQYAPFHSNLVSEPMIPEQLYPVDVESTNPTSIVIPKGYRLALTIQRRDFGYGPDADIVHAKDYGLPNSNNSGLFFLAHPNRDPALYGGTNTVAEAVLAEILQERAVSSRNHRRPRGVKRKMSNYNLRRKAGLSSRPIDIAATIRIT